MPLILESTRPTSITPGGRIIPAGKQAHVTLEKANELIASGDWKYISGDTIREEELARRFHKADLKEEE